MSNTPLQKHSAVVITEAIYLPSKAKYFWNYWKLRILKVNAVLTHTTIFEDSVPSLPCPYNKGGIKVVQVAFFSHGIVFTKNQFTNRAVQINILNPFNWQLNYCFCSLSSTSFYNIVNVWNSFPRIIEGIIGTFWRLWTNNGAGFYSLCTEGGKHALDWESGR